MRKLTFAIVILCTNSLFAQNVAQDTAQKDTVEQAALINDPLTVYGEVSTISLNTIGIVLDARYKLSDHQDISSWSLFNRDPRINIAGTYFISDLMYNFSNQDYSMIFSIGVRAMRIYQPIQANGDGLVLKVRFRIK
tara:strand:- start:1392 stop:1802 length:411 start_codon:yes stop_codon:yes gene_type:complete